MITLDLDNAVDLRQCRGVITPHSYPPYLEAFTFPGGEEHIKIHCFAGYGRGTEVTLIARLRSSRDVMRMLLAVEACRRRDWKVYGYIPYVPYARQDRVMVPGESFSLGMFLRLLKLAAFEAVAFFDPHSDVTTAIADVIGLPVHIISNTAIVSDLLHELEHPLLVAPDAGAAKKLAKQFPFQEIVTADKTRDLNTGRITKYAVHGDVKERVCLVVDDICDGGATFKMLAEALTEGGAKEKHLFVSHGIFSQGLHPLNHLYNSVATTDSFYNRNESPKPRIITLPQLIF